MHMTYRRYIQIPERKGEKNEAFIHCPEPIPFYLTLARGGREGLLVIYGAVTYANSHVGADPALSGDLRSFAHASRIPLSLPLEDLALQSEGRLG